MKLLNFSLVPVPIFTFLCVSNLIHYFSLRGKMTLKVCKCKFALSVYSLTKLCTLPWIRILIISRVQKCQMSYCDVIFDDVTKTWYTNFLISNHQIYRLKEHDQGTLIPKTVLRYDKYFSSQSNLKKFHFPLPEPYCSSNQTPCFFFSFF